MKVTYRKRQSYDNPNAESEQHIISVGIQPGGDRNFVLDMLGVAARVAKYNWREAEREYRKAQKRNEPDAWRLNDKAQYLYGRLYDLRGVLNGVVEKPAEEPLVVQQFDAQQLHDAVLTGARLTGRPDNVARIVYGLERPVPRADDGFDLAGL